MVLGALAGGRGRCTLIGVLNGMLVATNRATPFIITLGTMTFLQGVAIVMSGGSPINGTGALFDTFGMGYLGGVPYPVWVMLASVAAVFLFLRLHDAGPLRLRDRRQRGGDSVLSGVPMWRVKVSLYAINGLLGGFAGVILTGILDSGLPSMGTRL